LAKRLRRQCNVVALLLAGGDILEDFQASCAAVIGPLTHVDWHPGEFKHLVKYTLAAYPVTYAIVNSIEASRIVPPLARALVPTVVLVHEFAGYVRPNSVMRGGLESGTQIVFSAELVARSAEEEHPVLKYRSPHILPQGQTDRPPARERIAGPSTPANLAQMFRP